MNELKKIVDKVQQNNTQILALHSIAEILSSPFSFAEERDFHFASVRSVGAGRTARAERQVRSGRTEARPTAMGRGLMGVERSSVTLNLWETAC